MCVVIHSFHRHVKNVTIPCCSQELLPFLSVMYFFLPTFSTNYSSILSHLMLPSISWSTSQSCCSQIHIFIYFWESYFLPFSVHAQTSAIYLTLLSLLQQVFKHLHKFLCWLISSKFSFSLSYIGPKILLYTFLSKLFNCFLYLSVSVPVSDA